MVDMAAKHHAPISTEAAKERDMCTILKRQQLMMDARQMRRRIIEGDDIPQPWLQNECAHGFE